MSEFQVYREADVDYFSPLRIPEGKIGKFEIVHDVVEAGEKVPIVNMRDAIFQGKIPRSLVTERETIVHQLKESGGTWMSDCPQEIQEMNETLAPFFGKVLVGGLGIGYAATVLDSMPQVKEVVVIELQSEVIDLVWEHLNLKKAHVIKASLFDYLKVARKERIDYDYAFYDIWAPNGERVLDTHIRPLRNDSRGVVLNERLFCWSEGTMLGQVRSQLHSIIQTWNDKNFGSLQFVSGNQFHSYKKVMRTEWPFMNWMRQEKPSQQEAFSKVENYVRLYPTEWLWKRHWGRYAK